VGVSQKRRAVDIDVLPPASNDPELGYVEFAGWVRGAPQMLLARETRIAGRLRRNFEVARMDTLTAEKQAGDPARWPPSAAGRTPRGSGRP
jgi:hypothetical protein